MSRILVIDDEDSVRKPLKTVLTRKGHDVLLADGGQKGIDVFGRMRPLVTILDLHMFRHEWSGGLGLSANR
jgi:DNA-binding response OmpR family regulator